MIKRFIRCEACGSFRTENGEDVAQMVSKLEAKNAEDMKMFLSEHDENVRLHFENIDLKEKNARLRKALEKYANPETHSMDKDGFVWSGDYFDYETARAALEEK